MIFALLYKKISLITELEYVLNTEQSLLCKISLSDLFLEKIATSK